MSREPWREKLILENRGLCWNAARRLAVDDDLVRRMGLDDAAAAGVVGLISAADHYVPDGRDFTPYAFVSIHREICHQSRNYAAAVLPPKRLADVDTDESRKAARLARRRCKRLADIEPPAAANVFEAIQIAEEADRARRAIGLLPGAIVRQIVRAHLLDGQSLRDIAKDHGRTFHWVNRRYAASLALLRAWLELPALPSARPSE